MSEPKAAGERKWILIVEDEEEIRNLLETKLLMQFGADLKVLKCIDGVEATNRLPFTAFDLILTDLHMPKKEGRAFITSARQNPMNVSTPIIVVTGDPDQSLEREFQYLYMKSKPIDWPDLLKVCENQLKLGRTDQRIAADLLNSFIEATVQFFEQVLKETPNMENPVSKAARDPILGDHLRVIDLKSGKAKSTFVLGFPEAALIEAHKVAMKSDENIDFEKVTEHAGRLVFQKALKKIGNPTSISVLKVDNLKNEKNDKIKEISKEAGIQIPLTCKFGKVYINALW